VKRLLWLLALVGCGSAASDDTAAPDASDTFIAFASHFQDFRQWTSWHDDGPADDGTWPSEVLGPRTLYINQAPPHGSSEFPVGTIIVEAKESGLKPIFAGVKRGGHYNFAGALDWEWFEIQETDNGVIIVWRGVGAPLGDTYGGDPNGCNSCHVNHCADNDYICAPALQLTQF
jgi:hypothetical protein